MTTLTGKAAEFLALHTRGEPLLQPNAYDIGSARILQSLGFEAIATTSSGFARLNPQPSRPTLLARPNPNWSHSLTGHRPGRWAWLPPSWSSASSWTAARAGTASRPGVGRSTCAGSTSTAAG